MFLKTLLSICLLRANPQDLPASSTWMLPVLFAYALMDVVGVLDTLALNSALMAAVADTFMLVATTQLVLRWRHFENRIPQTLTALGGSGAILSFVAWALATMTQGTLAPQWIWGLFMLWYILVFGHVLRHSLSVPLAVGVAVSLLYLILSMGITGLFINPVSMEH